MLDFSIHWAWIPAIIIVLIGLFVCAWLMKEDQGSYMAIGGVLGCLFLIICVLVALVILGIFVW